MTTYRRKDGDSIGDYGWVTDLEFFDDEWGLGAPYELVKEVWVRTSVEEMTYPEPCKHEWDDEGECKECGAEREVVEAVEHKSSRDGGSHDDI